MTRKPSPLTADAVVTRGGGSQAPMHMKHLHMAPRLLPRLLHLSWQLSVCGLRVIVYAALRKCRCAAVTQQRGKNEGEYLVVNKD